MYVATYSITRRLRSPRLSSWVCETAPARHGKRPELRDWSEEELARIRKVLRRLTAIRVRSAEDAEDIVQETFLTMAEKCAEIEIEKGLLIWAMGILRNKIGNYYRRRDRLRTLVKSEDGRALPRELSPVQPPQEFSVMREELHTLILGTLSELSQPEREVIELLLQGKATGEIAQMLRPERYQNVVNRLFRGKRKLARQLARHGYGPRK